MTRTTAVAVFASTLLAAGVAHAEPRDDIVAAFRKAMDDGSYRMVMNVPTPQGPMETTMDVELPDRFHMKHAQGEFIVLPEGTWMNAAGNWMKAPMDMSQMTESFSQQAMEDGIAAIQNVRVIGEETIDGCDATRYAYDARGEILGNSTDSEVEVAICNDSGLPVAMSTTERGSGQSVSIRYDFDAEIDIRAPN